MLSGGWTIQKKIAQHVARETGEARKIFYELRERGKAEIIDNEDTIKTMWTFRGPKPNLLIRVVIDDAE
jgi:hypothetical protein